MSSMTAVQFRGLSSHYRSSDAAKVSFRYPVVGEASFSAAEGDQIGVFPENATTIEEKLLLAGVEEPSSHHLCDGGLYKTSSVRFDLRDIKVVDSGMKCRCWYIGSKSGLVQGKSDTFMVCANESEFPSISFGSMDDQTLLNAVHSRNSSYVHASGDEGPKSDSSTLESSFILVSEENSQNIPGSELASDYVMAQLDPSSEEEGCYSQDKQGASEAKCTVKTAHDSHVIEDSSSVSTGLKREDKEESPSSANLVMSSYVICPALLEPATHNTGTVVDYTHEIISKEDTIKLLDSPQDVMQLPPSSDTTTKASLSSEIEVRSKNEVLKMSDSMPVSGASQSDSTALLTPLLPPQLPADMSSSTVIVEKHVTQREARSLKSANRELRLKLHKLAEILEVKKIQIAGLMDSVRKLEATNQTRAEFEEERKRWENSVALLEEKLLEKARIEEELKIKLQSSKTKLLSIEGNRRMTESLNKKLLADKNSLEEKVKQLKQENKTIFERSAKLLTQLQDSETKREVLRSEKQVLQVKIDYLHAELRKIKFGEKEEGRRRQEMVSGMQRRPSHSHEKRQGSEMVRQQQGEFGRSNATPAPHGELLNQQHRGSSFTGMTSNAEYSRHALKPTSTSDANSKVDSRKPAPPKTTTTLPPPSTSSPPAHRAQQHLQVRPNQLPIQGARNEPAKTNVTIRPTTNATKDPLPPPSRLRDNPIGWNDWKPPPRAKEGGVVEKREDRHFVPLEMPRTTGVGERGRDTSAEKQHGATVDPRQGQGGVAVGSKDTERRISELEGQLSGGVADEGVVLVECPICGKQLHSRENDLAVMLHVEYCLQLSEQRNKQ